MVRMLRAVIDWLKFQLRLIKIRWMLAEDDKRQAEFHKNFVQRR